MRVMKFPRRLIRKLEHRPETDPDFVIPDLEKKEEIPGLDTTPARSGNARQRASQPA